MSIEATGYDMSKYWRLVATDGGLVTGTWWVQAPHHGSQNVTPVDVTVWVEGRHWGRSLYTRDLTASVEDGQVEIPEHMIRAETRDHVLEHIDHVKAAVLAAVAAVHFDEDAE